MHPPTCRSYNTRRPGLLLLCGLWLGPGEARAGVGSEVGTGVSYSPYGVGEASSATVYWKGDSFGLKVGAIRHIQTLLDPAHADPMSRIRAFQATVSLPGRWGISASQVDYPVPYGGRGDNIHLIQPSEKVVDEGFATAKTSTMSLHRAYDEDLHIAAQLFTPVVDYRYYQTVTFGTAATVVDPYYQAHELRLRFLGNLADLPFESIMHCRQEDDYRCEIPRGSTLLVGTLFRDRFALSAGIPIFPSFGMGLVYGRVSDELVAAARAQKNGSLLDYNVVFVNQHTVRMSVNAMYDFDPFIVEVPLGESMSGVARIRVHYDVMPSTVLASPSTTSHKLPTVHLLETYLSIGVHRW